MVLEHSRESWFLGADNGPIDLGDLSEEADEFGDGNSTFAYSGAVLTDPDMSFWHSAIDATVLSLDIFTSHTSALNKDANTRIRAVSNSDEKSPIEGRVSTSSEKTLRSPAAWDSLAFSPETPSSPAQFGSLEFQQHIGCEMGLHMLNGSNLCTKCSMDEEEARRYRADRRRKQNRVSQRRFREKKEAKMQAAQDEVDKLKKCYTDLQDQCRYLAQENLQLRAHCRNLETVCATASANALYMVSNFSESCSGSTLIATSSELR